MRALLYCLVLCAAGFGAWKYYQTRLAASEVELPKKAWVDDAPITVAEPLDVGPAIPKHLEWTLDPRWVAAEEHGDRLIQKTKDLYEWQENEGGDPLRFRREKKEITQEVQPLLAGLVALKEELTDHPGAAGTVEARIREFSTSMSGVLR